MRYLLPFLVSIILLGCNQEKIQKLEEELQAEKEKNLTLTEELKQYEAKISNLSDEQVVKMVEDFIDFRCPEYSIKDARVMQISEYEYDISCLYKHSTYLCCLDWSRTIIKLRVNKDQTYSVNSNSFPC
tara:strand:- start:1464 stop:1850 length:387 start_codon:yes stop_codon:yes gene_type:complete